MANEYGFTGSGLRQIARSPHQYDPGLLAFFGDAIRVLSAPKPTPEEDFQKLQIVEGDRIRLTSKTSPDASQLEGKVKRVKKKNGQSLVQIENFAVAGNNIFWPVRLYKVEVLHRAFRWTVDDELTVEIAGLSRKDWEKYPENSRESIRRTYAKRVERIKKAVGVVDKEVNIAPGVAHRLTGGAVQHHTGGYVGAINPADAFGG